MKEHPGGNSAVERRVVERQLLHVADLERRLRARARARPCARTDVDRHDLGRRARSRSAPASSPGPPPTSSTRRGATSATASKASSRGSGLRAFAIRSAPRHRDRLGRVLRSDRNRIVDSFTRVPCATTIHSDDLVRRTARSNSGTAATNCRPSRRTSRRRRGSRRGRRTYGRDDAHGARPCAKWRPRTPRAFSTRKESLRGRSRGRPAPSSSCEVVDAVRHGDERVRRAAAPAPARRAPRSRSGTW